MVLASFAVSTGLAWIVLTLRSGAGEHGPEAAIDTIVDRVARRGPDEERAALSDGRVTLHELHAAVGAVRECLIAGGVRGLTDVRWRGWAAEYEFDSTNEATIAYERCYATHQRDLDAVVGLQEEAATSIERRRA